MNRSCSHIATCVAILFGCLAGCTSSVTSNTARTAKEQLLLSDAVERSLRKVDFRSLGGQQVYVEEKYLECVDKPFVLGSVRHQIMRHGGRIVDAVDAADVVMELRSGGVGTDTAESFLGTPEIALPGMLTVPEIRLTERKTQYGYAKIGMVLYDAKTRQVLGDGGLALAQSDDSNWYVFGVGPIQRGSLKSSVTTANSGGPVRNRALSNAVAFRSPTPTDVPPADEVQFASSGKEVTEE